MMFLFILPPTLPTSPVLGGKAWIWLGIYANGLAGLASAMALVALVLWSYDQGEMLSAAMGEVQTQGEGG